jgi:hypothetical protein
MDDNQKPTMGGQTNGSHGRRYVSRWLPPRKKSVGAFVGGASGDHDKSPTISNTEKKKGFHFSSPSPFLLSLLAPLGPPTPGKQRKERKKKKSGKHTHDGRGGSVGRSLGPRKPGGPHGNAPFGRSRGRGRGRARQTHARRRAHGHGNKCRACKKTKAARSAVVQRTAHTRGGPARRSLRITGTERERDDNGTVMPSSDEEGGGRDKARDGREDRDGGTPCVAVCVL